MSDVGFNIDERRHRLGLTLGSRKRERSLEIGEAQDGEWEAEMHFSRLLATEVEVLVYDGRRKNGRGSPIK